MSPWERQDGNLPPISPGPQLLASRPSQACPKLPPATSTPTQRQRFYPRTEGKGADKQTSNLQFVVLERASQRQRSLSFSLSLLSFKQQYVNLDKPLYWRISYTQGLWPLVLLPDLIKPVFSVSSTGPCVSSGTPHLTCPFFLSQSNPAHCFGLNFPKDGEIGFHKVADHSSLIIGWFLHYA